MCPIKGLMLGRRLQHRCKQFFSFANVGALCLAVCLFFCSFVRLSPVKYRYVAARGGLSCRLRYTCSAVIALKHMKTVISHHFKNDIVCNKQRYTNVFLRNR